MSEAQKVERVRPALLCFRVHSFKSPETKSPALCRVQLQRVLGKTIMQRSFDTLSVLAIAYYAYKVSGPGESHPEALSEPDVNLSAHTAPIILLPVESPALANDGILSHHSWQCLRANGLHVFDA